MKLNDLVHLLANHDALAARQWVADALRAGVVWTFIPKPDKLGVRELAIAAGVVELLAQRAGQPAPAWTSEVQPAPEPVFLVQAANTMPRLRKLCETEGPEPLRRRRVFAPPDFLTAA